MANDSKADGKDGTTPTAASTTSTSSSGDEPVNTVVTPEDDSRSKGSPGTVQNIDEAITNPESTKDPESEGQTSAGSNVATDEGEAVDFKVIYNKKKYDISFPLDSDVGALKSHLQTLIGIPPAMMKVMIKGLAKDEMTLRKLGVTKGAKIMVVGSSLNDVLKVSSSKDTPGASALADDSDSKEDKLTTCKLKEHKKVLDMGKPDDAMVAIKGIQQPLPATPLTGMLNKRGGKVRLTFKLELDQVWIGTKERTEKVFLNSIKHVVSEPIEGHEEYHILALQMGPTEASRYWIYWVPAQYIEAIKESVLGKWQLF